MTSFRLMFVLCLLVLVCGCGRFGFGEQSKIHTLSSYRCDDLQFQTDAWGESAVVMLPTATYELGRVESASGAKYEGQGILFWSKGEEALLEVAGTNYEGCRRVPR